MIRGFVNAQLEAAIWVKVYGQNGVETDVEAIIDTGYDSYLTLPDHIISALALVQEAPVEVTLADGSVSRMDFFDATILWDGQPLQIPVLRNPGGPLIGMALLSGSRLTLDVVEGGAFKIEPLATVSGA